MTSELVLYVRLGRRVNATKALLKTSLLLSAKLFDKVKAQ
jgi:hypothetical protein